ncbi:MAG: hypothetical protein ACYCRH_00810 [Acidiferrobacteraceae bacterium]
MNIAVLNTGLFPDLGTMKAALSELEPFHKVWQRNAMAGEMTDEHWDQLLDELLASDLIITL